MRDYRKLKADWGLGRGAVDLLNKRGFTKYEDFELLCTPCANFHPSTPYMPNWYDAMFKFESAVKTRRRIGIYGDYDADGTCSAYMFSHVLEALDVTHVTRLASRYRGYGFSLGDAEWFVQEGCDMVITLDCGSNDVDSLDYLRKRGVDVFVLDHHRVTERSRGHCIVNPQLFPEKNDPAAALCTGGLSYLFLRDFLTDTWEMKKGERRILLGDISAFAMLATIADCTSAVSRLNRYIFQKGIEHLKNNHNVGLNTLVSKTIRHQHTTHAISWFLNPLINAAGRMGKEEIILELFMSEDSDEADDRAKKVINNNSARKREQDKMIEKIPDCTVVGGVGDLKRPLVICGEGWRTGIMGVVASRMSGNHGSVCLVVNDTGQGSGRVGDKYSDNVFDILATVPGLNISGHSRAFGVRMSGVDVYGRLDKLDLSGEVIETPDYDLDWSDYTSDERDELTHDLSKLEPFGKQWEYPKVLAWGQIKTLYPSGLR